MDSSGIYHTLASILASVSSSSVAQELENASLENQANLAQVLAEILRRENYGDADATKVLDSYIRRLIYDAVRDDSTMPGANFQLAVRLAHAKFLDNFVEETVGKMEELLRLGIQSHASSDDAFEVDMREFLEAHAKGVFNDTVQYSIEGQNIAELHDIVLRQLRFWNSHLLVNKTNVPSHTTKVASLLPARLLAAMGLRNQKIATASSDVLNHILNYHHASLSEYSEVLFTCLV
ncbi:hypothetical protein EDC01DRAFT_7233 [Geopyxis carbonaria]|nr:hypothetical protein EDC01DRAFT_7233 [Geopyxis carbonaria]